MSLSLAEQIRQAKQAPSEPKATTGKPKVPTLDVSGTPVAKQIDELAEYDDIVAAVKPRREIILALIRDSSRPRFSELDDTATEYHKSLNLDTGRNVRQIQRRAKLPAPLESAIAMGNQLLGEEYMKERVIEKHTVKKGTTEDFYKWCQDNGCPMDIFWDTTKSWDPNIFPTAFRLKHTEPERAEAILELTRDPSGRDQHTYAVCKVK